jgi:nucleotide-binding universal stress UspA family protein
MPQVLLSEAIKLNEIHPWHGVQDLPAVRTGLPADQIIKMAERTSGTMIVMATHGYSGLKRWALGSVADKILHATTTPLLLVRAQPHRA